MAGEFAGAENSKSRARFARLLCQSKYSRVALPTPQASSPVFRRVELSYGVPTPRGIEPPLMHHPPPMDTNGSGVTHPPPAGGAGGGEPGAPAGGEMPGGSQPPL